MLIKFKSKAAADIVMYKEHAKLLLDLLGKDVDRGIILHEEMAKAIATIEAAISESRAHPTSHQVQRDVSAHPQTSDDGDHQHDQVELVSFATRAFPLLEMLRAANAQGRDVVWGV